MTMNECSDFTPLAEDRLSSLTSDDDPGGLLADDVLVRHQVHGPAQEPSGDVITSDVTHQQLARRQHVVLLIWRIHSTSQ